MIGVTVGVREEKKGIFPTPKQSSNGITFVQ